jgi:hypothetical protein
MPKFVQHIVLELRHASFTGKLVRGRVVPMNKKARPAKSKKYAVFAGVNEPKKSCRRAVAFYAISMICRDMQRR